MVFWAAPAEAYGMSAAAGMGCYARYPGHPCRDPCCLYDSHESIIMRRSIPADPATADRATVLGVPCSTAYQRPATTCSKDCHMTYCSSSERTISGRTDDSQESSSSTSSTGSWLSPVLGWYADLKQAKLDNKIQHRQAKSQYVSERAKWRSTVRRHMLKGTGIGS